MKTLIAAALFAVLGAVFAAIHLPNLITDMSYERSTLVAAVGYDVNYARCSDLGGVVTQCSANFAMPGGEYVGLDYLFLGSFDDAPLNPLMAPTGEVTTEAGVDNLYSRAGVILGPFLIAMILATMGASMSRRR